MKFKRLLALETIYLQNTIPPACSIHHRRRINTIAPRDQLLFHRSQISAELKAVTIVTIIPHYSPLFALYYSLFATIRCSLFAIRVFQTPHSGSVRDSI